MKYWKRVGVGTVFYTVLGSCVLAVKWNTHRGGDHGISVEEENTVRIDANSLKFNKLPENTDFDNSWTSLWELADNVMDHQTDMDEMDSRKELMDNIDQHRKMVDHTNNQQTVSSHHLRKREAKKPKNTKKRKKLNKKKTEQEKDESESKHKLSSKSATSESEESETAPESSDATSSDSSTSSSSSYEDLSSGDLHNHDDSDDEDDSDDDDDDDSGLTEEVSVTSEEDDSDDLESSAEVYSGPDSSPPASSDSTDESSASKAISGGSSEISYTMSSSAEDAFPVSESDEHKGKKKKSESADKSKLKSGGEPKITTKIRKKKNKKITEIDIKLDKKKEAKIAKTILAKGKGKLGIKEMEKSPNEKKEVKGKQIDEHGTMLKGDLEKEKVQLGGKKTKMKDETKLAGAINIKGEPGKQDGIKVESMLSTKGKVKVKHASVEHKMESFIAPGDSRIRADLPLKTSVKLETLKKPGMEMMKVKKAEVDPKKKAELEQELIKDYPVSGTVEITNWQGTFAPIAGEPYVAPLHHQPDSFWDAIYRSTDPDLPTPPGVVSLPEGEADPFTPTHPPATHHSENTHLANHAIGKNHLQEGMLMKNKDKGKKQEKKKPKLSPKEKKKKKKEKQQEKQGSRKVAGVGEKSDVHLQGNLPVHALAGKSKAGPHVQGFTKPNVMHAATKSEEHLKTPSEEERESGTTYKPEGAYEYPSFRHPDFNPDTAYDENGIPIHESPGWTPPPTLPGDHRFGKERSRAGAGLKDRAHGPIMKPNVAVNHKTETQHLSNNHLHPNIEHHKEVMQHMQQSLHPDTPNHQVLHNLQPPLHLNTANLRSPQTSQSLQAHIAAQEHEHLQESLHGLHMNHPAHDGKDHLHDPIHLADHHEPDNHHGVPLVLPAQHQGIAIKDGIANHKIQKRKADSTSAELKEDSSGVMSTKELTAAAEEYKKQVASKEFGVYSTYPDSEEYVKLADEDPIAAYEKEKKLRTMNPFTGSPRTTRHYFQKTSKPLLRRRSTLVTQAGTKKPYTGFILTLRPRRPKKTPMNRLKSEVIFLKKTQKTTQDGNLITTVPPTAPPMRSSTETPIRPPVTSATWWPPGVYLGPRSRRPPLHPHIIQPALLKWERKFPKIWFRTGGTRFTYPPEVENYPFTFDWHVPKKKRVDRWTMRPDWPLDSPLFKDNIPDYIEDVTLPPIPEMGETLYPKTSPKPWWTYPPWWEQKIAAEANGTTPRTPRTLKTSKPTLTTIDILKIFTTSPHKVSRTKMNTELTFDLKNGAVRPIKEVSTQTARKTTVKRKPTLTFTLSTSKKSPETLTPTTASMRLDPIQQKKVVHHVGPWWKLTIVEHVPHPNFTHSGDTSGVRLKRSLRKYKGLVIQNAIRRKKNFTLTLKSGNKPFPLNIYLGEPSDFVKRESSKLQLNFDVYNLGTSLLKQNDSSFHKISEIFKSKLKNISASIIKRKFVGLVRQNVIRGKHISTEQKKNYISPICSQLESPDFIEKKEIELQLKLNFSNFDKPLLNQNVSNFSIIKTIFKAALKEIYARRNQGIEQFDLQTISNFMEPMKMPFELKNHLISLLPSLLKKRPLESRKANLFYALTGEIRRYILNIMKIKMFDIKAMLKYKASDLRIKSESKLRIVHFLKLFYKPKLANAQWTRSVLEKYGGTKFMVQGTLHKQERNSSSLLGIQQSITDIALKKHFPEHLIREKREEKPIELGVSSFNWSSHSMENVVDELVNELPMKTIKKEVKKDMITELHKGMMQKFGRTDVNEAVVSRMAKIEAEEANPIVDKVMENSVREVIQKLLDEVLTTLRQNTWVKTSMVKLFEEGYSVESVVDAISNQISISSLLDSMEKEGVNITQSQRHLVLTEFKDYKQLLNRMLKKEVELWEYQLLKNPIIARRKRNTLLQQRNEKNLKFPVGSQKLFRTFKKRTPIYSTFEINRKSLNSMNKKIFKSIFRDKRAIGDSGFMEEEKSEYDEQDLNIDKELSAIEKSSMSDGRKIKKLKKHLKWLQSQTQSPAEIVFPENFEEDLMRTEGYDDEGSDSKLAKPKRFKQKFQWRVRTKKPTLKVITFLPKIRLTRGRPFMPLTTTEETLVIPETHPPTRRRKTKTPHLFRKVIDPTFLTTQPLRKPIWLDLSQKTLPPRSRVLKARPLIRRTTSQPARTFAQMKSFKTMKFGQKTQQPVISLQEFLKRRNEFRRVREEVMWNKNFHTSSEELPKGKNIESSEQSEELTEETDLSFDGKLSMEVKPEDFTLRPLSDFLYTWPVMTTVPNSNVRETTDMPVPVVEGTKIPKKSKSVTRRPPSNSTRRRYTKKTGYTRASNRGATRKKIKRKIEKPSISGLEEEESKDLEVLVDSDVERNKRDISTTYSLRPFTSGIKQDGKNRSSTDDEPLFGIERNISRRELEEKIRSKKSSWAFGVPLATDNPTSVNTSSNSFETYQQEHKKWFGERRRGVPVNNYDIDWDQMRRKLELQEISSWYKLKEQRGRTPKFDRTQLRKYWSVVDRNMNITEITTVATTTITVTSPPLTVRPIVWYDKTYIPEFKKYMTRPFFKNYIYEGSLEKKDQHLDGYEPPFGRVDKTGKTLFGRLYREPRKRHYHVQDDRDSIFAARDLRKFVNRTYDADFRIGTHRRTLWQNRTFDPNYIFTQHISWQNFSRRSFVLHDFGRKQFERLNSSIVITPITTVNRSQISDPDFDSYMNLLQSHQVMSHKMKHHENRTVGTDNSFIPQRSSKVPWNNDTDPELYKAYRMARKRFYNKTLDIAFSYYIFNKYRSGNLTRDVGYGRMSNVVNRWYNRTFQPKYRPDMFYLHNRGKFGKEFNYHRNELHSDISGGKLDPERWHRVVSISNRSTAPREFQVIKDITEDLEILPREKVSVTLQTEKAEIETTPFELLTTTTVRRNEWYRTTTKVPAFPTSKSAKSSFFQSVKEKGLGFFKTFFTRQDSDESEEE